MSLFNDMTTLSKQYARTEESSIEHIATCRDGGSMLLKFEGENYLLDHGIGSKFRGRIFKGSNHQHLEFISPDLDIRIRAAYSTKYGKCLPFEESGSYTFEKPAEPEPSPTVSLYNLLDHSELDLDRMTMIIIHFIGTTEAEKEHFIASRESAFAWLNIFQQARRDVITRDSEAWAEKTAKEIKEADNQFQAQLDSGGTL